MYSFSKKPQLWPNTSEKTISPGLPINELLSTSLGEGKSGHVGFIISFYMKIMIIASWGFLCFLVYVLLKPNLRNV